MEEERLRKKRFVVFLLIQVSHHEMCNDDV